MKWVKRLLAVVIGLMMKAATSNLGWQLHDLMIYGSQQQSVAVLRSLMI